MILPRFNSKQGQVTPFLVLVSVVLILAIAATMLIGEVSFNRIRMSNIADSALISVASSLCRNLNQIRQISFGPAGLLVTYVGLQAFLLARGWPYKGAPLASGFFINSMLMSKRLYQEAKRVADEATKNIPSSLYDRAFGGGLVDEPKPFLAEEVTRDGQGKITGLIYESYLNRDSRFTSNFREFKKEYPEGATAWYQNSFLSYSYNKTKEKVLEALNPDGSPKINTFSNTEPLPDYEAYLRVQLKDVPTHVSVSPQRMIMLYFYYNPKCSCVMPAFVPHPYAWIKRVNIDSNTFGLSMARRSSFSRLPFFGRSVTLEHENSIRIRGSVWPGYDFRMEE